MLTPAILHVSFRCLLDFFFNDTATTEIYSLSLHDALPISMCCAESVNRSASAWVPPGRRRLLRSEEHTSELHHANISYAVFCLKKKKMISAYFASYYRYLLSCVYESRCCQVRIATESDGN